MFSEAARLVSRASVSPRRDPIHSVEQVQPDTPVTHLRRPHLLPFILFAIQRSPRSLSRHLMAASALFRMILQRSTRAERSDHKTSQPSQLLFPTQRQIFAGTTRAVDRSAQEWEKWAADKQDELNSNRTNQGRSTKNKQVPQAQGMRHADSSDSQISRAKLLDKIDLLGVKVLNPLHDSGRRSKIPPPSSTMSVSTLTWVIRRQRPRFQGQPIANFRVQTVMLLLKYIGIHQDQSITHLKQTISKLVVET